MPLKLINSFISSLTMRTHTHTHIYKFSSSVKFIHGHRNSYCECVETANTRTNVYGTYARRMRGWLGIRPCKEWLMGVSVAGELAGFMGRWFYERI